MAVSSMMYSWVGFRYIFAAESLKQKFLYKERRHLTKVAKTTEQIPADGNASFIQLNSP